jgi:hypothetical protein
MWPGNKNMADWPGESYVPLVYFQPSRAQILDKLIILDAQN